MNNEQCVSPSWLVPRTTPDDIIYNHSNSINIYINYTTLILCILGTINTPPISLCLHINMWQHITDLGCEFQHYKTEFQYNLN